MIPVVAIGGALVVASSLLGRALASRKRPTPITIVELTPAPRRACCPATGTAQSGRSRRVGMGWRQPPPAGRVLRRSVLAAHGAQMRDSIHRKGGSHELG